jgi:hypothetical protein
MPEDADFDRFTEALRDAAHRADDDQVSFIIYRKGSGAWGSDTAFSVRRYGAPAPTGEKWEQVHRVYPPGRGPKRPRQDLSQAREAVKARRKRRKKSSFFPGM